MHNLLETAVLLVMVVVLAAIVVVCVMWTSVLAVDRASVFNPVGAFGSDDDLSIDSWCSAVTPQASVCR